MSARTAASLAKFDELLPVLKASNRQRWSRAREADRRCRSPAARRRVVSHGSHPVSHAQRRPRPEGGRRDVDGARRIRAASSRARGGRIPHAFAGGAVSDPRV